MNRSLKTLIALLLCALLILSAFAGQALAKYVKSVTVTNALSVTIIPPADAQEPASEETDPAETDPTQPDEEAEPTDPEEDDATEPTNPEADDTTEPADSDADSATEPTDSEPEGDPDETNPEAPAAEIPTE